MNQSTSQIQSIAAENVMTTFNPYASDQSMLGGINVTDGGQLVYGATYGYNAIDQIDSASVVRTNPDNTGSSDTTIYTYGTGSGDTGSDADSLTQATDTGTNASTYSYTYDGVGNFTNNAALGTPKTLQR